MNCDKNHIKCNELYKVHKIQYNYLHNYLLFYYLLFFDCFLFYQYGLLDLPFYFELKFEFQNYMILKKFYKNLKLILFLTEFLS